ncbi:hypothetical protein ILUMI_26865 [Ignelater luminosus]|uniref:Cytochrome P450 n=1 Tax=Ignelater luminosus TaxID=2038154 RepID=A0A8K0C922_IGNLU|nr:hypothetical protein ILUMI_26865 [Ignelater luminosus]
MDQLIDKILDLAYMGVFVFIIYLYYKCASFTLNYWKQHDVPYVTPLPFLGNLWNIFTLPAQIAQFTTRYYYKFDTPYFGMFILSRPYLVIRCPELIKQILGKNFHNSYYRSVVCNENCKRVGSRWKYYKPSMISLNFSTYELDIIVLMNKASREMITYIKNKLKHEHSIEIRELCAKFATDIIGSCVFGIDANSFRYNDDEFIKDRQFIFDFEWKKALTEAFYRVAPNIVNFFKVPFFNFFYVNSIKIAFLNAINERQRLIKRRNDLMDTLMQIKRITRNGEAFQFVGCKLAAEATQFIEEGFEIVSSTVAFALYELCLQEKIQWKAHCEVVCAIAKYQKFTYEALQDMPYLDLVLYETLRKYPARAFLDRVCEKDYQVPNNDLVIEKGTSICIPVLGLHYDTKYFVDPEKFNPGRFCCENRQGVPEFAYIPFENGSRCCLGKRFGFIAAKLALAAILLEYEVIRNAETPVSIERETRSFLLASKVNLPMTFKNTYCVDSTIFD